MEYKIKIRTFDKTMSPGMFGRPTTEQIVVIIAENAEKAIKEVDKKFTEYILEDIEIIK